MACMYFLVYAAVQLSMEWTQFTRTKLSKFGNSMMVTDDAMNFVPTVRARVRCREIP